MAYLSTRGTHRLIAGVGALTVWDTDENWQHAFTAEAGYRYQARSGFTLSATLAVVSSESLLGGVSLGWSF